MDVSETLRSGAGSGDVGDGEGRLFRFTLYRGVEVNAARTHGLGGWCCWAMIRRAGLGERRDGGRVGDGGVRGDSRWCMQARMDVCAVIVRCEGGKGIYGAEKCVGR
jgi:hypothetical protein